MSQGPWGRLQFNKGEQTFPRTVDRLHNDSVEADVESVETHQQDSDRSGGDQAEAGDSPAQTAAHVSAFCIIVLL